MSSYRLEKKTNGTHTRTQIVRKEHTETAKAIWNGVIYVHLSFDSVFYSYLHKPCVCVCCLVCNSCCVAAYICI